MFSFFFFYLSLIFMRLLSDLTALITISRVKFFTLSLNFFVILVKLIVILLRFLDIYITISPRFLYD